MRTAKKMRRKREIGTVISNTCTSGRWNIPVSISRVAVLPHTRTMTNGRTVKNENVQRINTRGKA